MLHEIADLPGVYRSEPTVHPDERGTFHEWFRASVFEEATGYPLDLQQANLSTSKAGVLRGLHLADVPPGQAKYVVCVAGRILDVVMDVRVGSETFGRHVALELSEDNRHGVFIPVGFAHGFLALEDSTVAYLTTSEYQPGVERAISPYSAGIDWPGTGHLLSDKDRGAITLDDARLAGLLPDHDDCVAYENELRDGWVIANEQAGS